MLWGLFGRKKWMTLSDRYRTEHSVWLTGALGGHRSYVRIPVRRSDEGGFSPMTSRTEGRARADLWWQLAFERTDPA